MQISVESDGGIVLPEEVRKSLGIDEGSVVRVEVEGSDLAIYRLEGARPWRVLRPGP